MVILPGSVLWLFLLVHLVRGQISDNLYADKGGSDLDDAKSRINGMKARGKEDKNGNENTELEAKEEEVALPVNPRRVVHRTGLANATDPPQMSPERRRSYISIAERRKYYNRTRTATTQRDGLLYQETANRPSNEKMIFKNEIRESRQSAAKERGVTEGRKDAQNQRIVVGTNETLPKTDNVTQTVIYSLVEFGQKLRKTAGRAQDKTRRRKEKTKEDPALLNSTNKINKITQTQSTKLVKVNGSQWSTTTRNPKTEVETYNLVMPWKRNKTNAEKVAKYIKSTNNEKLVPIPLSFEGVYIPAQTEATTTDKGDAETTTEVPSQDATTTERTTAIPNEVGTSRASVKTETMRSPTKIMTTTTITTTTTLPPRPPTATSLRTPVTTSSPQPPITTTSSPRPPITSTSPPTTPTTTPRRPLTTPPSTTKASTSSSTTTTTIGIQRPSNRKLYLPSVEYKSRFNYTRRPTFKPNNTSGQAINRTAENESKRSDRAKPLSPPHEARKWRPTSTTGAPSTKPGTNTEQYPLTIEINENNKRVLSEMFRTTTEFTFRSASTTRRIETMERAKAVNENASAVPSPTSASTTAEPEDFGEDHKPVGTSYNTKFYIIPNVTKTEVIKIVETEEDAENEVLVTAQTVGIAVYIIAAFGLIPLLLAFIFGARFFLQRHRRKDDCDSDMRSDISADCRRRQGKGMSELKKSPSNVTTTTLVATTRLPRVHHWESCEKNKNWEFPRSNLKLLTILGQGNFGQVWKAEAEDMPGHEGLTRLVAVKTVKEGATEKEHGEFIKELEIMQQMGSHSNIVTLLGCCTDQEPYYLIMEYVMNGKLLTYLREHRTNENYYNISNNNDALTSRDLTVFAYCVARGMEYLASKGIIHRDLAARNVLVDHNKLCKIADFGMSRSLRDSENGQLYEERQHKGALPIRWMAPESLLYSLFTHKSDVWSFGIVMWEIVTLGSTPYPNMGAREVMRRVREGYRLERPHHCKQEFYQLISHCWAHDPNKRPDFGELRRELANLLDDASKDGIYVDLDSFAVSNRFHVSNIKTNDFRLIERNEFKTLKRLDQWEGQDWPMENKKIRPKRCRNNGKGTVTLTGHGSFTVNSRILEKEFKLV